jgi:hypothetical protein
MYIYTVSRSAFVGKYAYKYIYLVCTYLDLRPYLLLYICMFIVCIHACMQGCVSVYAVYVYIYIYIYIRTHVCKCIRQYVYIHRRARSYVSNRDPTLNNFITHQFPPSLFVFNSDSEFLKDVLGQLRIAQYCTQLRQLYRMCTERQWPVRTVNDRRGVCDPYTWGQVSAVVLSLRPSTTSSQQTTAEVVIVINMNRR